MATVIGPQTRVLGGLGGKDDLVIEGTVEGPIEGEAAVTIAVGARVNGAVRGRDVTVAGELSHPVFATGTVRLLASAHMSGDIEAGRIAIDEGATFDGAVRMRRRTAAAAVATPAPAAAAAPAPVAPSPPAAAAPTPPAPATAAPAAAPLPFSPTPISAARQIPELASPGRKRLVRKT
jgi:cytoskeletal protein CcmA (bactofilin family)